MQDKSIDFTQREFPMTNGDFELIKDLAYKETGINLSDHKKNMIYGRLVRRLRKLELKNFSQYCDLINQPGSHEMVDFINSITTNLTSFFRENHHFEFLHDTVLPQLMRSNMGTKRIRIWSAGCSTGEEPYSIAMVVKLYASLSNWDVKILATDLDSNVVAKASEGVYSVERVEGVAEKYKRFLLTDKNQEKVKVKDSVRNLITFKQLNLLNDWPMNGPFDVIFCRNVVIYFDADTQRVLFSRYAEKIRSKGHLFIGHSESLHNISTQFKSLGKTIYESVN